MTQAVVYLATAPKSNTALTAYAAARKLVREKGALPVPARYRPGSTAIDRAHGHGQGYLDVIPQLDSIGPVRVAWDNQVWYVPPGIILAQAINHATEHRAQIMTTLTQLGLEAPEVSGWEYVIATIPTEPS